MPADPANKQLKDDNRDPQAMAYIVGLVYMQMGEQTPLEEVQKEVDRLYDKFQKDVFDLAYGQMSKENQEELRKIVEGGASQKEIQDYVLGKIPDFQTQLEDYILKFQEEYIPADGLDSDAEGVTPEVAADKPFVPSETDKPFDVHASSFGAGVKADSPQEPSTKDDIPEWLKSPDSSSTGNTDAGNADTAGAGSWAESSNDTPESKPFDDNVEGDNAGDDDKDPDNKQA